jgi:hypothetical protein
MGAGRIPGIVICSPGFRKLAERASSFLLLVWRMASASSEDVRKEVRFKYWWAMAGMVSPRFAV